MEPIIPQPQEQPKSQYQASVSEPKHFMNKKFVVTLIILGLLGACAYAGIWWWGKKINPLPQSTNIFSDCEEKVGDSYQNNVSGILEIVGNNYVFTVHCNNKELSIYVADPNGLDSYLNIPITVEYQYSDYLNNVQCVRAPCPPIHETRIKILSVVKTSDPTSDWKTYTNTEYGFEIRYPAGYLISENNNGITIESSTSCKTIRMAHGGIWPKDCFSYNLLIQKNKISGAVSMTMTQVAGYPAERFEINDGLWEFGNQTLYQFVKGGNWFISSLTYNSENKVTAESLFNQILSTFKFTK